MARVAATGRASRDGFSSLSSVIARYRADQNTLVSTKISQLTDLSGNARHLVQATDASRFTYTASNSAFNNRATADATGSQDMATSAWSVIAQPIVYTAVAQFTSMSSKCLLDNVTGHNAVQCTTTTTVQVYDGTSILDVAVRPVSVFVPAPRILTVVFSGTSSIVYINGLEMGRGNAGTAGSQGLALGTFTGFGNGFQGSVAEVVVQNTAADLPKLWRELGNYYAIGLFV